MEVFMDDFTVYADLSEACLENLSKVLKRCIDTNLVLNFEKCHFMYPTEALKWTNQRQISSLPFQTPLRCGKFALSWDMQASIEDSSRISANLPCCYRRMWNSSLTSPILKHFRS
ncbi:hypothetical protein CR513_24234, partial [Mucuna pruriens]